ncbi:MAG TPA: hypothetical protein VNO30_14220 [Kofleriaceae bacterium]|nr:hypothetical protein [Kofleriaceae bacterium]
MGRRQVPQLFPLERHGCGELVFQRPGRALVLDPAPPLDPDANPYRGLAPFRDANPYRGLAPFREEDRALFFGRAAVARAAGRGGDRAAAHRRRRTVGRESARSTRSSPRSILRPRG